MATGYIHKTNLCGCIEIVKYINANMVDVKFTNTGSNSRVSARNIRIGNVSDKFHPSILGKGFLGVGEFKSKDKNGNVTNYYNSWKNMLTRCYCEKFLIENESYIGCTVNPIWHNFQNFAKWYNDNYPTDGGTYHIDKDLKVNGNKEYGPSTCMIVTAFDNVSASSVKSHIFVDPIGRVKVILNLKKFCLDNGLNNKAMHNVAAGRASNHKGWTSLK